MGEDIFVHHTGVQVGSEQYKYLVQGEYVHFTLRGSDSSAHPYQAANLTGPYGGQLMCETRNENRKASGEGDDDSIDRKSRPRRTQGGNNRRQQRVAVHVRGTGPREGEEWMLVRRKARGGAWNRQNRCF